MKGEEQKELYIKKNLYKDEKREHEILSKQFMSKYIQFAKQKTPVLTSEASEFLSTAYPMLRKRAAEGEIERTITVRTLETLIRLGTAHAKLRLSGQVVVEDM